MLQQFSFILDVLIPAIDKQVACRESRENEITFNRIHLSITLMNQKNMNVKSRERPFG